jgi:hypothetical protein
MSCGTKVGEDNTVTPPTVFLIFSLFASVLLIAFGVIGNVKKSIVLFFESASSSVQRYTSKSFGN